MSTYQGIIAPDMVKTIPTEKALKFALSAEVMVGLVNNTSILTIDQTGHSDGD